MMKGDHYYFTDSIFQMEINLHNIRRELILMIEEFEKQDCLVCMQLKCRCPAKSTENHPDSGRNSRASNTGASTDKNKDDILMKSPPADTLPEPKFGKGDESPWTSKPIKEPTNDIEAWIASSKVAQNPASTSERKMNPTDVLLATLKKSWNEAGVDVKDRGLVDPWYANTANAVEAFFSSFKVPPVNMTPANIAYITNKLTAAYVKQKAKKAEYSYF